MRNVDQLRHAIDRGRTGSKVAASDPAAAPLGTDDEAAGTPVAAREVEAAWEAERKQDVERIDSDASRSSADGGGTSRATLLIIGVIAIIVAASLLYAL